MENKLKIIFTPIDDTPSEDLYSEHGILNRLLLIYDNQIINPELDMNVITIVATIIRYYIEDHHEKTEETLIFPLFIKQNKHVKLIDELVKQHKIGRKITSIIFKKSYKYYSINKNDDLKNNIIESCDIIELKKLMSMFVNMYRAHESREDTILFKELKDLMDEKSYKELGEKMEQEEVIMFGKNSYSKILGQIIKCEKKLHINDISFYSNFL